MINDVYPGMQEDREYAERAYKLGERLGINRESLKKAPVHGWMIPMLERMLDAIEKLEEKHNGER